MHWTRIVLFAVAAGTACSGAARSGTETPPQPADPDAAAIEALYRARMDSALIRFTADDVRFLTGMIAHHAQALVMSEFAPTNGASPTIRVLAARIINAQKDEIALMQQWLRDRDQPVPEVHTMGNQVMVHGADHALMPGMLTPDQMRQLADARGPEFDRLFLTFMIQHHRGAVTMVHDLFGTDGAMQDDLIFKIASDIQVDQLTEIDRMERMLSELPANGRAP